MNKMARRKEPLKTVAILSYSRRLWRDVFHILSRDDARLPAAAAFGEGGSIPWSLSAMSDQTLVWSVISSLENPASSLQNAQSFAICAKLCGF